jgi:hypothetical protein
MLKRVVKLGAVLVAIATAALPAVASANDLCNTSAFSSLQQPEAFASMIMGSIDPTETSAGTHQATCTTPVTTPSGSICMAWTVATTSTNSTVAGGERAQADMNMMVQNFQAAQMLLCNTQSIQTTSFSSWASTGAQQVQQHLSNAGSNGTDDMSDAESAYELAGEGMQQEAATLATLESQSGSITGETSAIQWQAQITAAQTGVQQQQFAQTNAAAVMNAQGQYYGFGMTPAIFDLNGSGDSGFGWGN